MAVAFDVVGTKGENGATTSANNISCSNGSHNCATSDANTVVIVTAQMYKGSNTALTSFTCTYNGVAMTALTSIGPVGTAPLTTKVFYMFNPPTGSQAIVATANWSTATTNRNIVVTSESYTGVDTITNANTSSNVTVSSTTITTAAAVPTDGMGYFAHGTQVKYAGTLTYNQTLRFSGANTLTYTGFSYLVVGDAAGAGSTITSTASWPAGSGPVQAISCILNPSVAVPTNTGAFFAMF